METTASHAASPRQGEPNREYVQKSLAGPHVTLRADEHGIVRPETGAEVRFADLLKLPSADPEVVAAYESSDTGSGAPSARANKPAWVAYATTFGWSPEDAEALTVPELKERFGTPEDAEANRLQPEDEGEDDPAALGRITEPVQTITPDSSDGRQIEDTSGTVATIDKEV